jgi:drug/metabolite transporter (DMT)-like permease
MAPDGLWIALTVWAGFAQTLRNAAQRSLVGSAGTLGATLVRFLFGLPFALLYLGAVLLITGDGVPGINWAFFGWVFEAGLSQIAATALLLRVMQARNFAIGVAYSKTELVQVAIFGAAFLGDPTTLLTAVAVILATLGVLLLSPSVGDRGLLRGLLEGWTSQTALLGVASGAGFAIAAVGYRGAALELGDDVEFTLAAAYTLVWAMSIQVVVLGGWLLLRNAAVIGALLRLWKQSMAAGFMGAAASAGWFTAFAIEPAAHVRTLGLVELLFSLAIARRFFRESLSSIELFGVALLTLALVLITLGG